MAQVSASAALYVLISGTWTQLNDVQPWDSSWGIPEDGPLDNLAETGELKFRLDNSTGLYTPDGPSALAGFVRGAAVKLVVTYDSEEYIKFRGYITEIEARPSIRDKTASVTCLDWLDYASRHPVVNPGILLSKLGNEVMDTVIAGVQVPPQQTAFDAGTFAFPTSLDLIGTRTTTYAEMAKIVNSDLTYSYLKKDRYNGETLVLEGDNARHGWVEPGEIPLAASASGFLLLETGDKLLLETGDKLILNETASVTFGDSVISDFKAVYGDSVINRATAIVYPRRLDTSPQILFQLDKAFELTQRPFDDDKRGQNFVLKGTWANPNGGTPVGGRDMVTPVITTDYLMNSAEDGSGTNISSSLYFEIEMGTEGFTAYLANTDATYPTGYVTKFNVRGTGIYDYNPIEATEENDTSIAANEAQQITMNQRYKTGTRTGAVWVKSVVKEYGDPRMRLKEVDFCANKSSQLMMAFLNTDVGDLREIYISEIGNARNCYIQGVEARYDNGLIWVKWLLKEAPSRQHGFTGIAVDFTSADGDAVNYGPLPRVSNDLVVERTFSAWINADLLTGTRAIIAPHADTGGMTMFVTDATGGIGALRLYSNRYSTSPGQWRSTTTAITTGSWFHVVVCFDHRLTTNDPIMYINGTAQSVTEMNTPAGTLNSELGTHVVVGNAKTLTINYEWGFDGQIADARIYNRIITADEVTTLYNGGTLDASLVTDGLVFQAFDVREEESTDFIDVELDSDTTLFENAFRAVGNVHGSPIGRASP
jgi:concanavalin A-like lectin/glucanase superfamily protein